MPKSRVLAICVHNSARSQMTEAYLRQYGGDILEVESAGIEPGSVNPVVVELLAEDGIDISGKATQSVFDLAKAGRAFDYVIAVCDPEASEQCPIFPAERQRLHWPFADPSKAEGSFEERVDAVRPIREQIRSEVQGFVRKLREGEAVGD